MPIQFQRLTSLALACALMLSLSVPALAAQEGEKTTEPTSPRATAQDDGTFLRGSFTFGPHENTKDLTDTFIYSDDYFSGSSYTANEHLATMSMQMAAASISSEDTNDYTDKSQNVQALLTALGFQDVQVNGYYKQQMQQNTMGVAVAYKKLNDDTVLLAIVPRSAGYEKEWGGNFNVGTGSDDVSKRYTTAATDDKNETFQGTGGLHAGFQIARNIALKFTKEYVTNESRSSIFSGKTIKVWTMGYSRGAATANLIGAALVDDAENAIGLTIDSNNVYDYTFGTPLTVLPPDGTDPSAEKYNGIHNYFADYDPVTMVPFSNWGFTRYGQNTTYNDSSRKAKMLEFLRPLNENVYQIYTNQKGDVDNFTGYTLGEGLTLTPSGQTLSQRDFLNERISYLSKTIAKDRTDYANKYQAALSTLVGFYLGESDDTVSKFVEGIANNKTDLMLAVTMLAFYDWAEEYHTAQTTAQVEDLVGWIKKALPEPRTAGSPTNPNYDDAGNEFLASEGYQNFYTQVTATDNLKSYFTTEGGHQTKTQELIKKILTAGLNNVDNANLAMNSEVRTNLLNSVPGLTKFLAYFVFGTGKTLESISTADDLANALIAKVNTAATLIGNAGTYMRVHNNEVILSWVRTLDSYYMPRHHHSSKPSYAIDAPEAAHGSVTVSNRSATKNTRVTLTVTPDEGYELASLTVTDQSGTELTLTEDSDGRYTFDMPGGPVTVNAVFQVKFIPPAYESFSDLLDAAWYREGVTYALQHGLMNGVSDETFAPEATTGRAMVLTVLWRLSGSPDAKADLAFPDVSENDWHAKAVRWAAENGIASGYPDGRFGPDDAMTREQMAAVLYRFAQSKGYDTSAGSGSTLSPYADAASVSAYAAPAMQWACGAVILTGTDAATLSPKASMTRAQMATMMMRFCKHYALFERAAAGKT